MGKILSFDISHNPAKLLVLDVKGDRSDFIEKLEIDIEDRNFYDKLTGITELVSPNAEDSEEEEVIQEVPLPDVADFQSIAEIIKKHEKDLISSVLVIHPYKYVSLNLEMPFNSKKLIDKVIDLEVQDQLPFRVDDYLVNHKVIDELDSGTFDVHVGMLPSDYVKRIVDFCHGFHFDPEFITTPSAVLAGVAEKTEDEVSKVFINFTEKNVFVAGKVNGKLRNAQAVPSSDVKEIPFSAVKMLLLNWEDRYNTNFEKIILVGNSIDSSVLKKNISLPVESLDVEQRELSKSDIIAYLAAESIKTEDHDTLLNNFRIGELAYRPILKVLTEVARKFWLFALILFLFVLVVPLSYYYVRKVQIGSINSAMHEKISETVSWLSFSEDNALSELMGATAAIETQLNNLGSLSRVDPLTVYIALAQELREASGPKIKMDLTKLTIKGSQVDFEGTVPKYQSLDKIERILKRREDIFCGVKKETPGGRSQNKRFKFKLTLC